MVVPVEESVGFNSSLCAILGLVLSLPCVNTGSGFLLTSNSMPTLAQIELNCTGNPHAILDNKSKSGKVYSVDQDHKLGEELTDLRFRFVTVGSLCDPISRKGSYVDFLTFEIFAQ